MSRKRRKKESPLKTVSLILMAAFVLIAAIYVVVSVFSKINDDYKQLELTELEESSGEPINIEIEEQIGWNETDEGWKYLFEDNTYAENQWMEIQGFFYNFDEQGIMRTGQWKSEGQIFTCHETKGYLQNIQTDLDYIPENTGENLDSLVTTNAFWCFLSDEDTGLFKTIQYRKSVDNKVMPLGDESVPEKTTKNSMRADKNYVYYLPKVKEKDFNQLSESEKALCNTLFRMIPGQMTKELIAENVGGYLILEDKIVYSQNGEIASATSGVEIPLGEEQYSIIIKDDVCYLVDFTGNPVSSDDNSVITVGDRSYKMKENGEVQDVQPSQITVDGNIFYLKGSGNGQAIYKKTVQEDTAFIKEEFGVQSYCIVDRSIYYSAYVDKGADGNWNSQIFKADLDGNDKQAISKVFSGEMYHLYYYNATGEIYGEYLPYSWKQAYGVIAVIGMDGTISMIEDETAREGKETNGNDMMTLVMAKDQQLYCYWRNCQWNKGITDILWSKGIKLDPSKSTEIEEWLIEPPSESETETQEEVIVQPIETSPSVHPEDTIKPQEPSKEEFILGTDPPGKESSAVSPTTAPANQKEDEVTIIPLG